MSFFENDESEFCKIFLNQGYALFQIEDLDRLKSIRNRLYGWSKAELNINSEENVFFDNTGENLNGNDLNDLRVKLIQSLAKEPRIHEDIYACGKKHLSWIVGNELAMQRSPNLSIQLPGDLSSTLPLHTDVWSGNSPYEVVMWVPFVDVYKSKSMYILPLEKSRAVFKEFHKYSNLSFEEFFEELKSDLIWLDIPFGSGALFSHSLLHGNIVNAETESRWSMNVRFKSLLSPYGTKPIGESFIPITIRPATRVGYTHIDPEVPQ